MGLHRRVLAGAGITLVLGLGAVAADRAASVVGGERYDVAQYLRALSQDRQDGRPLFADQPQAGVVAAGEQSCAWLRRQPVAPDRAAGRDPQRDSFTALSMYWR